MKSVYIAGPYSAPTRDEEDYNIRNAALVAAEYYKNGYAVYCPHLQTSYIDRHFNNNQLKYEDWLERDIYWINKCDVVVFLSDWDKSRGAQIEHMVARGLGKEIHYVGKRRQGHD